MNDDVLKAAVARCASELSRAIFYRRAYKALREAPVYSGPNFIHLAMIAFGDMAVVHASKVLREKERAGFWAIVCARKIEANDICNRLGVKLTAIKSTANKLQNIRDKTLMHLDPIGVTDPRSVWLAANVTNDEFDQAVENAYAVVRGLHEAILGRAFYVQDYDGSDAKLIAEAVDKMGLHTI
jgi:hypothetical protein